MGDIAMARAQTPGGDEGQDFTRLRTALATRAKQVDACMVGLLPRTEGAYVRIQDAMRYAVTAGGKRLRPFLVWGFADVFDVPEICALRTGAAIEALHTYSLVHDDLPCMDDDVLRRGMPTTHVKFDEATALLAGDALLTLAFEILSDPATHPDAGVRCELVARLAKAAGSDGMIGGQMMDMLAPENKYGQADVIALQRLKTGALFEFSCEAGAILGKAGAEDRQRLNSYAQDLGLAFQIADDLIDASGSSEVAGKTVGKDAAQGKATLVSILGADPARRHAGELARRAADTLSIYGPKAELLRQLPAFLLNRDS